MRAASAHRAAVCRAARRDGAYGADRGAYCGAAAPKEDTPPGTAACALWLRGARWAWRRVRSPAIGSQGAGGAGSAEVLTREPGRDEVIVLPEESRGGATRRHPLRCGARPQGPSSAPRHAPPASRAPRRARRGRGVVRIGVLCAAFVRRLTTEGLENSSIALRAHSPNPERSRAKNQTWGGEKHRRKPMNQFQSGSLSRTEQRRPLEPTLQQPPRITRAAS